MNLKKALLAGGLIVALIFAVPATQVMGGEPAPDPDVWKIVGPTMWAVGVVDCDPTPFYTLRIKKIEDCDVDTEALSATGNLGGITGCPTESDVLNYQLPAGEVFDLPCPAIITKVKNFKAETGFVSFDAQIRFLVPNGGPDICASSQ